MKIGTEWKASNMPRLVPRVFIMLLLFILLIPFNIVESAGPPPLAQSFKCTVTLDGSTAPDGTGVTANMRGETRGSGSVSGGLAYVTVSTKSGDQAGDAITFFINGTLPAGSASFVPGESETPISLSATSPPVQYTLTINTNGNGSVSGAGTYNKDTVVNVSATPASGWKFDNWTGPVADANSASTTVTMDANKTITANFSQLPTFTLTMAINGQGTINPTVGGHTYTQGTVVNVSATPASGWNFVNWTGPVANANSASTTVTIDANKTVTANFSQAETVTLTITINGSGTTNPPAGSYTYIKGETATITATPASGWNFVNWTGSVNSANSATTSVTMDASKTVTANFSQIPTVTLTMAVSGEGTVSPVVGNHVYTKGQVVDITATPASGWNFTSWSGGVASASSATTTVTMDANKTVTANFTKIQAITLTMAVNGQGTTTPPVGAHDYSQNDVVTITATPATGWNFVNWTGPVANAYSTSTTVTMDTSKTVTANFTKQVDTVAPVVSSLTTANVTKTDADITWVTDEPSSSQVEYWASPSVFTPLDAKMVTQHTVHLTGLIPATLYHYRIISVDASANTTTSPEGTFTTLGNPAAFVTSNPEITMTTVDGWKKVSIDILVTNSGDKPGVYAATLSVNDNVESTQSITLEAGVSQKVTFTTVKKALGVYKITVSGGLSFTFTVEKQGGSGSWPIPVGITLGIILVLVIIYLLMRRNGLFARTNSMVISGGIEKPDRTRPAPPIIAMQSPGGNEENKAAGKAASQVVKPLQQTEPRKEELKPMKTPDEVPQIKTEPKPEVKATKPETEMKKAPPVTEPVEPPKPTKGLNFTPEAIEKLRELKDTLQSKTTDPDIRFRLVLLPGDSQKLLLILDREKDEDQILEMDGRAVVILAPDLVKALDGMVIDYQRKTGGAGFVVVPPD